ncbi:hypothetical protein HII13_000463 [Brettanomyces bruxellensis]|nr:hypothetical protein HII13_000463 [Brettanomyces bruxellensis]
MEGSTVTTIIIGLVAFVMLNYFMSGAQSSAEQNSRRRIHHVTAQMIDTVRQVAPSLTEEQISYDLEQTGDVNTTVDRYLRRGTLPFPPGHALNDSVQPNLSLVETVSDSKGGSKSISSTNSNEGPFGGLSFEAKRIELVHENRKALEKEYGIPWSDIVLQK